MTRRSRAAVAQSQATPAPPRLSPEEELELLCRPVSSHEASRTRPDASCAPHDTDEAWAARMVGVCARCGLRRLDELGRCGACGARKAGAT